jgi:hypothetical protein
MTARNKHRMSNLFACAVDVALLFCSTMLFCPVLLVGSERVREVLTAKPLGKKVSRKTMQNIYEEIRTPYKYGVILKDEEGQRVDCPSVFRHSDLWYMMYIVFDGSEYETAIAQSHDLLRWKPPGRVMRFRKGTWDARQAAGAVGDIALQFFEKNGAKIKSTIETQIVGLDIDAMGKIPCVIGVAGRVDKTDVVRAALLGRLISVLITDDSVAADILRD